MTTYRVRFSEAAFAVLSPIATFDMKGGHLDDASLQNYRRAIRESVSSSNDYIQTKHTDLSFGPAAKEPWQHVSVSHITLAPGKRAEFMENLKKTAIPRWKKMGMPALLTWEVVYGPDTGQFILIVPIENYAELSEGPPFYRGLSEAQRTELLSGVSGAIVKIKRVVADYLPDVSYAPE